MFNPNKITKVIKSFPNNAIDGNSDCLTISPLIEYVSAPEYHLILQTEKDYISIGNDGVHNFRELPFNSSQYDVFFADDCFNDTDDNYKDITTVLFVGERLLNAAKEETRYVLTFDDFTMYLYTDKNNYASHSFNALDFPIHAFDRHIKRKCECGGNGELMLTVPEDYIIRCDKCHKSTYASFDICETIDDWNNGNVEITYNTGEEDFLAHKDEPVNYIAIDKNSICYDENVWETDKIIVSIGSLIFGFTQKRVGDNRFGYEYSRITTYNENHYPYRIVPSEIEPMRFIGMNYHDEYSDKLLFAIGKRHILISADDVNLTIGLTHMDVDYNTWIDFDNSVLINQILK